MATLVFLHGLNTYGDDLLHVGPLSFGLMHSKLEAAFRERDVDFIPVTGLGCGSPEEQAERALAFLDDVGLKELDTDLHILGQSIGGLVARVLASRPELKDRIRSVMTMGTPHEGTRAALFGLEFAESYPRWSRLLAAIGYDTRTKAEAFQHFTPDAMREFNLKYPAPNGLREISLVCEVEKDAIAWPLLGLYNHLHAPHSGAAPASDGFILSSSQRRGEAIGPFELDHFAQLGYFFQVRPQARRKSEREFERLLETICEIVLNRDVQGVSEQSI